MPILDLVPSEPAELLRRSSSDLLAAALATLEGMAATPPNPRQMEIRWSQAMLEQDRGRAFQRIRDRAQELGLTSICFPDLQRNCTNMIIVARGGTL